MYLSNWPPVIMKVPLNLPFVPLVGSLMTQENIPMCFPGKLWKSLRVTQNLRELHSFLCSSEVGVKWSRNLGAVEETDLLFEL